MPTEIRLVIHRECARPFQSLRCQIHHQPNRNTKTVSHSSSWAVPNSSDAHKSPASSTVSNQSRERNWLPVFGLVPRSSSIIKLSKSQIVDRYNARVNIAPQAPSTLNTQQLPGAQQD